MKKILLLSYFMLVCVASNAQDKVVLRDSTILNVNVVEINDKSIFFSYPNETLRNEKPKNQIAYIIYASGRREEFKQSVQIPVITNSEDWEKVIVTNNREDINGLEMIQSITVSGGAGLRFSSATSAHEKAINKLKKKAAEKRCGIVLIISENFGGRFNNISTITGEAYK